MISCSGLLAKSIVHDRCRCLLIRPCRSLSSKFVHLILTVLPRRVPTLIHGFRLVLQFYLCFSHWNHSIPRFLNAEKYGEYLKISPNQKLRNILEAISIQYLIRNSGLDFSKLPIQDPDFNKLFLTIPSASKSVSVPYSILEQWEGRERRALGLSNQIDLMLATILRLVCDW
ncbi:hypothetical protein DPMN_165610 [Dreissena polymorpha]|uniref:Uncharacterized protein n=1 Tax=Dreissena polymorpha TaxID=45954 RepID=A0A9D4EX64_DREPO|nr:hypothetical protein DPMN_165610 [Dreissena polymorpha]